MSPKVPHLTSREVVRILEREGFVLGHQRGSHAGYAHPDGRRTVVPMHKGRTIGIGLLKQILKEAEIDPDSLRR